MNNLIMMADEYMASALGCAGHSLVKTPNIDRLAAMGVRFDNAYTPSPMCVPARAALQTGLHVHKIRNWSSAEPYRGNPEGWGHALRQNGGKVASIGKLHFGSSEQDNGFDPELLPLHVTDGEGWVPGLLRKNPLPFDASSYANNIGPGTSSYSDYDQRIFDAAKDWLRTPPPKPWTLFVSFVCPHYPLVSPPEFFALYDPTHIDQPHSYLPEQRPNHPVVQKIMASCGYDQHFDAEKIAIARAAYYGLCSYIDHLVGGLLDQLDDSGLTESTRIIFTADHGEMLGNHGCWTKMLMYEDSVKIPLIIAGPDIAQGKTNHTPVSLLDIPPMLCADQGLAVDHLDGDCLATLSHSNNTERVVISQYHDGWSPTGFFMVRWGNWKYIHYVDHAPQLFDLLNDPLEQTDLGLSSAHVKTLEQGEAILRRYLNPEKVNENAFADQNRLIAHYGGEVGIKNKMELYFDYTPLSEETLSEETLSK